MAQSRAYRKMRYVWFVRCAFLFCLPLLACSKPVDSLPDAAPAVSVPPAATPPVASVAPVASAPPSRIAAQHVLIAYKGAKGAPAEVKRSKAEAKARAEEVRSKAVAGADFSTLAAEYSDDPASKTRQGNLGAFNRDAMVKPFADAAFALPVDGVSAAVETPYGFHIIKRNQ